MVNTGGPEDRALDLVLGDDVDNDLMVRFFLHFLRDQFFRALLA